MLLTSTLGKAPWRVESRLQRGGLPSRCCIGIPSRLVVSRGATRIVTVALTSSDVTSECQLSLTTLLSAVRTFLPAESAG